MTDFRLYSEVQTRINLEAFFEALEN
jgi:hypothetical protein